ncbi:glycosyltransferase family 2 protein [Paenibacillus tepidiphilus]|uniref:glycosyltransferase family 2 protein n=1 Tax=Paenibacillus tepidiphilus TaxID=2608683 RepID=UPI001238719D|nr:glycosyltransferase [Paenibacillus tepidiphilus]
MTISGTKAASGSGRRLSLGVSAVSRTRAVAGSRAASRPAAGKAKTAVRRSASSRQGRRSGAGKPAAGRKPGAGSPARPLPGLKGALSVIITARNEADTLPGLLKQVERLSPAEIIVVLNGCTDYSYERSRLCRKAIIVHCPESAGHDVGRALGAKLSRGDILLFLDGDMNMPASKLAPFAHAVDGGVDVALNDLDGLLPPFGLSDNVTRCKLYLNAVLDRQDLGASSLTAVPHALSRRALECIGCRELMVPPKAHALALMKGLRVEKAGAVNVIKHNRLRESNTGAGNAVEQLIAGDHAEALHEVLRQRQPAVPQSPAGQLEERRRLAAWRNRI